LIERQLAEMSDGTMKELTKKNIQGISNGQRDLHI